MRKLLIILAAVLFGLTACALPSTPPSTADDTQYSDNSIERL